MWFRRVLVLAILAFSSVPMKAQTSEFLPEVDTYFGLNSQVRIYFQAKETREGGDPIQAEVGPSIEFYVKPLIRLHDATEFDLDQGKKRVLVLAVGYRYLPSPSSPATNRLRLDGTSNFPMKGKVLISARNRFDLDWQNGKFTWRYRNKLTIERTLTIHRDPTSPLSPFTRVNITNGARPRSTLAICFPSASTFSSIHTTSTRTIRVRVPISN